MGFRTVLLGRREPAKPDLNRLFGLAPAALPLEAATGLTPTGVGAVCFRGVEGGAFGAFARTQRELERLLGLGRPGAVATLEYDAYGFGWVVVRREPDDLDKLVIDLHVVNSTLEEGGFGSYLVCSYMGFRGSGPYRLALVYAHLRGTFYPFSPKRTRRRRNEDLEARAEEALVGELQLEPDRARWFPLWDAPGL
ncbi:hypothetical protein J4573_36255 [Actinomadura barringtoniae]|uniref:Uncharacterized protein n=1 Tax=Actinomadura barringtoniae TaxID=1427535 RepID=A0A939PGT7_9ACTN|nr:hypothetical protein [Actinomadura barringtoniae]MBO2452592.1 hypothetical protein [Actinomadura barringtoniae]